MVRAATPTPSGVFDALEPSGEEPLAFNIWLDAVLRIKREGLGPRPPTDRVGIRHCSCSCWATYSSFREPIMAQVPQEPPSYRVFYLDAAGKIKKSKPLDDCANDEEAIEKARGLVDERRLELFDGCRLVIAFPAKR